MRAVLLLCCSYLLSFSAQAARLKSIAELPDTSGARVRCILLEHQQLYIQLKNATFALKANAPEDFSASTVSLIRVRPLRYWQNLTWGLAFVAEEDLPQKEVDGLFTLLKSAE